MQDGSIFLMPTESNTEVATALRDRYGQPLWRFTNSGTETTMPAIRAARAFTGRNRVVKTEGGYHGQYDWILSSHKPPLDQAGPATAMKPVGGSTGIPDDYFGLTSIAPFNDLERLEEVLRTEDAACFIVEPALTNIGIVLPDPGYLAGAREICDRTGTLLIFDEVKIGITASWGGATEYYGVHPDILCVSKSIGGGLPLGAFGGRADIMEHLRPGGVTQVGTFSGNPLAMAACRAVLLEVCTPETTAATVERASRLTDGMGELVAQYNLPAQTMQLGARGCLTWSDQPIRNYRDTLSVRTPLAQAQWMFGMNRGTLMPPGLDSQWLMSVQHTDADVDATVEVFADFVEALTS
jgi:glutamate-1-semialdehyde 2,1-aminomutase